MKAGCRVWVLFLLPLFGTVLATGCRSADPFGTAAQARDIEYKGLLGEMPQADKSQDSTKPEAKETNRIAKVTKARRLLGPRSKSPEPPPPAPTPVAQASPPPQTQQQPGGLAPAGHW